MIFTLSSAGQICFLILSNSATGMKATAKKSLLFQSPGQHFLTLYT